MAVQPPNRGVFGSHGFGGLEFSSVSEDLKKMLVAYAEKQKKPVQAILSEVVAKMPVSIRSRVALRGYYPENETALLFFFTNLSRNKDAIAPFCHALESLAIYPPAGSWSFAELIDYIPAKTNRAVLSVVAEEAYDSQVEENLQESLPEMDELTGLFQLLSLEITQLEQQSIELKTTLESQKYTYRQLHEELKRQQGRLPAQESAPKRDLEAILDDLKAMLKKYATERQINVLAVIAKIVAKMPLQVQGNVRLMGQYSDPDEALTLFLGNVLRHKAQGYLYNALEAFNINSPHWKFCELTDYTSNGHVEKPPAIRAMQMRELAYDPLSRDFTVQVPLARLRKLELESENRKLVEELRKLKEDLDAVTSHLRRWKEEGKW